MAIWDDWQENITKAFRYVPMVDSPMDVFDLLSGKTPDQIAEDKVRVMDDELTQYGDPLDEDFDFDFPDDEDDGFFDNLGDMIGNVAGKFKVGAEDLTDNVLNAILDQFDEQTLSEQFGDIDPATLNPAFLEQMAAEDEAKQQAKESGEFWRESPMGGFLGELEDIEQKIGGGIVDIGQALRPTSGPFMDKGAYQEKIDQLHTLLDPNDPASTGEILEDLPRMAAEGILNTDILKAWIESPQFGRGLDPEDVQRMYGSLDSLVDQITPLIDHLDELSIGHRLPASRYKALTSTNIMIDAPIVTTYKESLQAGADSSLMQPPVATNIPTTKIPPHMLNTMVQPGGTNIPLPTTAIEPPGATNIPIGEQSVGDGASLAPLYDIGGHPTAGMDTAYTPLSDAATAGHPTREGDPLINMIGDMRNADDATLETTLAEVFYTTVFQLEDSGRPDVRSKLPDLLNTTSILFELYNPEVHLRYPEDKDKAKHTDTGYTGLALKKDWDYVGKAYGAFLNDFLKPGGRQKYMGQLQNSIDTLNTHLARGQQGSIYRGDTAGELDIWANYVMTKPGHLTNLAKIYRTNGRMDYTAQRIHGYLDELAGYWRNMGMSEAEIFSKLTVRSPQKDRTTDRPSITEEDSILDGTDGSGYGSATRPTEAGPSGALDDITAVNPSVDPSWGDFQSGDDLTKILGSGELANMPTPSVRTDDQVLSDAIRAHLTMTGAGNRIGGQPPDPSVEFQAVQGLSPEHLESMPTPYNEEENAKRMKGLPYVTLLVKNGKRTKGTRFVPTRGYKSDAGDQLRKRQQQGALGGPSGSQYY